MQIRLALFMRLYSFARTTLGKSAIFPAPLSKKGRDTEREGEKKKWRLL